MGIFPSATGILRLEIAMLLSTTGMSKLVMGKRTILCESIAYQEFENSILFRYFEKNVCNAQIQKGGVKRRRVFLDKQIKG
jgi:hypothetical protein